VVAVRVPDQHQGPGALGYQIWELDQPHSGHAHGRSLTGHQPSGTEHDELASLRQRFTTPGTIG
jgi:hypothetical protein